jgi:putative ribosome biogenesis GTPase RsgA
LWTLIAYTMPNDVVIAVMGLTGVGKSTFIKNITGREDIKVGHTLESGRRTIHQTSKQFLSYHQRPARLGSMNSSRQADVMCL